MAKKKRVFTRNLKVELTPEEIAKRAIAMAGQHAELARVTLEEAEIKKQYKATLARIEAEITEQVVAVNSGFVYREVECEDIEDWDGKRIVSVRRDTGEEIDQRPMTEKERQLELPLDEAPPNPDPTHSDNPDDEAREAEAEVAGERPTPPEYTV